MINIFPVATVVNWAYIETSEAVTQKTKLDTKTKKKPGFKTNGQSLSLITKTEAEEKPNFMLNFEYNCQEQSSGQIKKIFMHG